MHYNKILLYVIAVNWTINLSIHLDSWLYVVVFDVKITLSFIFCIVLWTYSVQFVIVVVSRILITISLVYNSCEWWFLSRIWQYASFTVFSMLNGCYYSILFSKQILDMLMKTSLIL